MKLNIKNIFRKKKFSYDFYENFFVKNSEWNGMNPNSDELTRWNVIKNFLELINLPKTSIILDIGCGRGWLTNLLREYGDPTGIDPVEPVVIYAKNLFPELNFYSLTPREYGKKRFKKVDIIVMSEVIEHIKEKREFLLDVMRLLKNPGYLILSTPRGELRSFYEKKYGNPSQPIENWIDSESLKLLLINSGLTIEATEFDGYDKIYQFHLTKFNKNDEL